MLDIVIPVGINDVDLVHLQVEHTRNNVKECGDIYIVSSFPLAIDGCFHVDESAFPFSIDDVACIHGRNYRNGWYLQQLLKFYASSVIPSLSKKYLVVDADTFFLRPVSFLKSEKMLFNFGSEFHNPYFEHMQRLHPTLVRVHGSISGIVHHMVFDSKCIAGLFSLVESYNDQEFWRAFLRHVSPGHVRFSGASEYEIYLNFMLLYRPDLVEFRRLEWTNSISLDGLDCDYASLHWYLRKENLLKSIDTSSDLIYNC